MFRNNRHLSKNSNFKIFNLILNFYFNIKLNLFSLINGDIDAKENASNFEIESNWLSE